jgi:hypothetical protein
VFLQDISTKASHPAPAQFEDLLPAAHWVPLPREAQVRSNKYSTESAMALVGTTLLLLF